MFYVSDNPDTALRETVQCPDTFAIGKFRTRREAKILDLTDGPPIPSLFTSIPETSEYDPRQPAIFLNHFAAELSKPIARDDRSHIEYIPPQIITEYFRIHRFHEGVALDGIRYRSARHADHCSLVLFATQDDLIDKKENQSTDFGTSHDPWIELTGRWQREVTKDEFEQWNREWQQNEQHEREWSQEDQWL